MSKKIWERTVGEGQRITIYLDDPLPPPSKNIKLADSADRSPCRPCPPCPPCASTNPELPNTEIQGLDTSIKSGECPPCSPCKASRSCTPYPYTDPESPHIEILGPYASKNSVKTPPYPLCPPYPSTDHCFMEEMSFPIGLGEKRKHDEIRSDHPLYAKYKKGYDGTDAVGYKYPYKIKVRNISEYEISDFRVPKRRLDDTDFDSSEAKRRQQNRGETSNSNPDTK